MPERREANPRSARLGRQKTERKNVEMNRRFINRKGTPTMRSIGTMACYALVIAFALLVMPTGALALTFTTIDVPGAAFTEAAGINPQGDIVGFYIAGTANHGFLLH